MKVEDQCPLYPDKEKACGLIDCSEKCFWDTMQAMEKFDDIIDDGRTDIERLDIITMLINPDVRPSE
jgi:hypothetical protein